MSNNTKKKKFELYKKGIILYRLTNIINILDSMKKATKAIQKEFRSDYSQIYEELKQTNNAGNDINNYGKLLGVIKNNFKAITQINSNQINNLKNNNQLNIYKKLITNLNNRVKKVPNITKNDQIVIKKYLGTLINNFYYIFNIDLSLKNNIFPLNDFYKMTMGNKRNNSGNNSGNKSGNNSGNKSVNKNNKGNN